MREQWDKWAWAVALVVIALVVLRAAWGREAFCGSDSEQCFREWVSALGGWAAVGVAIPTIIYLSKQISDAERHHRRSSIIELRQTRALATLVKLDAEMLEFIADLHRPSETWPNSEEEVKSVLETLKEYSAERFIQFEAELGPPNDGGILQLRKRIQFIEKRLATGTVDFAHTRASITRVTQEAERYAKATAEAANLFLADPAGYWDKVGATSATTSSPK